MFVINDDMSIYVTRGDIVNISLSMESNGEPYKFNAGDVVRLKVFGKKDCANVVLEKDFPVVVDSETVELFLSETDTKIGGVINKHVDYWYEIELNPDTFAQTIIGYDDDGAKIFRLFPEGRNSSTDNPDVTPEDVSIMDDTLDLLSKRPVENRVITAAIASVNSDIDNLEKVVKANKQEHTTRLTDAVDDINNTIVEHTTRLTDAVSANDSEITDLSGKLNALEENVIAKHNELNEIVNTAFNVTTELNGKYTDLSNKHTSFVDNQADLHSRLDLRVGSLEVTKESQDEEITRLGECITEIEDKHNQLKYTLWQGEWSEGSIFTENPEDYMLFKITLKGIATDILAIRHGQYVRGIGGNTTGADSVVTYHFSATIYNNQWTMVACNGGEPFKDGTLTSHTVTSIVGII